MLALANPLEFGEFKPCADNTECSRMLDQYKLVYREYIDQHQELANLKHELRLTHETTVPMLRVEISRLNDCLERELGEKAILEQGSPRPSDSALRSSCDECVQKKRLLDFLRGRCSHNSKKTMDDCRFVNDKLQELENEVRFLQSRVSYFHTMSTRKNNLFWRDEEVAMLRNQLHSRTSHLATRLNADPASFRNLEAEVLALRRLHAGGQRGLDEQDEQESTQSRLSTELWELKVRTDEERAAATTEIAALNARLLESETGFHRLFAQYEGLKQKLAKRRRLKAVFANDCPERAEFESFFRIVEDEGECLEENVMYDAFFDSLDERRRERFVAWMYACCHQGRALPLRDRQTLCDARVGKKTFAACLWAIGGVFKRAFNGRRNVWINVRMTKKEHADDLTGNSRKRSRLSQQ